jgi:hypothetical protein
MEQRNFGDRFKWIGVDHPNNITILEFTEIGYIVVEKNPRCSYSIGDVWLTSKQWNQLARYLERDWEYIGNFGKSSRFREIYNILNNE